MFITQVLVGLSKQLKQIIQIEDSIVNKQSQNTKVLVTSDFFKSQRLEVRCLLFRLMFTLRER